MNTTIEISKSMKEPVSSPDDVVVKTTGTRQVTDFITPYTHFFTKRCLNGRNVACARSNEIKVRLRSEI